MQKLHLKKQIQNIIFVYRIFLFDITVVQHSFNVKMNKTYCSHLQVFKENMGQKMIALLVFSQSRVFWCEMTQRIRSKVRGQCSIPCSSTAGSAGWGSAGCCPSPSCVSIAAFKRNKVWGNQQNHFFQRKIRTGVVFHYSKNSTKRFPLGLHQNVKVN